MSSAASSGMTSLNKLAYAATGSLTSGTASPADS
jgi:hypothetical protein